MFLAVGCEESKITNSKWIHIYLVVLIEAVVQSSHRKKTQI